jgi:putative ABC transport system permease protein
MIVSALTHKSWTDLTRRRARTVFAVSTLAIAVASVGIFAVSPLMDRAMNREVRASQLYDLQLSMAPVKLSPADVRAIEQLPNVRAVVARPWFATRAYAGTQRVKALVVGAPDLNRQRVDRVTVTSGGLQNRASVLTDIQNARQGVWGGRAGDSLRIVTTSGRLQRVQVTGEARSMIASDAVAGGILVVYASPATVAHLTGGPDVGMMELRLQDTSPAAAAETVAAVRSYLRAHTSFTSFSNLPAVRASGDYPGKEFFGQLGQLLSVITLLALVSGLFLIGNTMSTLVAEQTTEIGMMKAMGGSRRRIGMAYIRTALLLGLLGTLIGVPLGIVLSNFLASYFAQTWYAISPGFGVVVPIAVAAALVGLVGPVLASLPAIRKATAVPVVNALTVGGIAAGSSGTFDRALRTLRLPKNVEIGVRSMGRRKRRTLGTTVLVALGVANLLALVALGLSVTNTSHAAFDAMGYDIALGANNGSGGARPLDTTAQRLVVQTPGVAAAQPFVQSMVKLRGQDEDFMGIVPNGMIQPGASEGRWLQTADQEQGIAVAVIGADVARATGVHLGDQIRLETGAGPTTLRVVGLSTSPGAIQHIYVPLKTAQHVLDLGGEADGYLIRSTSSAHAAIDATTIRLEDRLTAHGYPVSGSERYVDERQNVASNAKITNAITALGFMIVAISMIGLVNTMTANVLERTREIGILRCIGAHRRDIRRIFESEGLAVSVLGWLAGIPLGYLAFRLLLAAVSNIMNLDLVGTFPLINIPIALVGTVVLALLMMILPLRRAIRFHPGDALRYQ